MLCKLDLVGFKCFETLNLPFGLLTLLTGVNGGGKSSVMQALMLLAQTIKHQEWGTSLLLEGPELALGSVADVLNQNSSRRNLSLGITTSSQRVHWAFQAEERRALAIPLQHVEVDTQRFQPTPGMRWLMPAELADNASAARLLRRLSWITAERSGPRELLPLRINEDHPQVGRHGEMAAALLYWHGDEPISSPVLHDSDVPPTLLRQTQAYMQDFFPGCGFRISPIDGASSISLRLRSNSRSEFQRPQNVGFGLTQLFPIIVAILAAQSGDVLLVENPEVHLHPSAQQRIGMLLAKVAATGVQIVLETHSDHVLNGVRLAVKHKLLSHTDTKVHFFAQQSGQYSAPLSPSMDADGRLDTWPEGFFDQMDFALAELI